MTLADAINPGETGNQLSRQISKLNLHEAKVNNVAPSDLPQFMTGRYMGLIANYSTS